MARRIIKSHPETYPAASHYFQSFFSCAKRAARDFFDRDSVTFSKLEEDIRENRFPDSPDTTAFRSDSLMITQSRSF